ncbi:MAG: peptidylprolyl isomerase [Brevundimonas sp.]
MKRTLFAAFALTAIAVPALAQTAPASAPQAAVSDWRVIAPENLLVIDTNKGRVLVELAPEIAPLHVERIRLLAGIGFYDNLLWHRVIDFFMAQTGDPLGNGEGQSPYPDLKAEFMFRRGPEMAFTPVSTPAGAQIGFMGSLPVQTLPDAFMANSADGKVSGWALYCPGVAGMARDEGNDTANSQMFLMRQAYPSLDKRYTVWGRVVAGLDVVRSLKFSPEPSGMVTEPDRMVRVRVASTLTEAERPVVQIVDTRSTLFRALADSARSTRGADFSPCDIELPVQVSSPPVATPAG